MRACACCTEAVERRLRILDHGHRLRQTLALRAIRVLGRTEPDPVAKVSLYRPELFGRPWLHFAESIMRGPSEWTAGERELIAAFVSRLNSCPFCTGVNEGTSSLLLGPSSGVDQLAHWQEGRFEPRLAATFVNGQLAWDGQRLADGVFGQRLEVAR